MAEHHARYVRTGGASGHLWNGIPTLLLTTRGRRSGILRRMPLIYRRDGDAYVVVASNGGSPGHPGWYHNLRADPDVTIQVVSEVMPARARTAEGEERERLWAMMAAIYPNYDIFQGRTARQIPVVVLEPTP
jgi:deazaflavin-dependent oxidoreductase (nitroreductase family)